MAAYVRLEITHKYKSVCEQIRYKTESIRHIMTHLSVKNDIKINRNLFSLLLNTYKEIQNLHQKLEDKIGEDNGFSANAALSSMNQAIVRYFAFLHKNDYHLLDTDPAYQNLDDVCFNMKQSL